MTKIKDIIIQLLNKKLRLIISLIFTMIFTIGLKMTYIVGLSKLIDEVIFNQKTDNFILLSIIVFSAIGLSFLFLIIEKKQLSTLGTYISTSLLKKTYSSLLEAEINEYDENIIDCTKKIVPNCQAVGENYFVDNICAIFSNFLFIIFGFILLLVLKPWLSFIVLFGMVLLFAAVKGVEKFYSYIENKKNDTISVLNNEISKNYDNIRNIKLVNSINYEKERFDKLTKSYIKTTKLKDTSNYLKESLLVNVLISVISAIIISFSCWIVYNGGMKVSVSVLITFIVFVPQIFNSFRRILRMHFLPIYIKNEVDELERILNLKSEIKSEPISSISDIHSLTFNDVSFYANKKKVFSNLSFEVNIGEKFAIFTNDDMFRNSVFNIITKMSHQKSGEVTINNCEISKINTTYLRDIIASVHKDSVLIDDTIIKNISYPNVLDDYKYNDALNRSGLKDIISELPSRANTVVTDELDKDIIARIIYANAFYKDSKIYIINDSNREMNLATDCELVNEVYKLKSKIIIVMTNKVQNIIGVDKVLFFENGEVVEYGKYNELLQDKSSRLYKMLRKSPIKEKKIG